MKIITPPLAHNTLINTPTTQRLTFWLIELKICIFIKSAPPLAYQTNCTLTFEYVPPTYKRVKRYKFS